MAGNSKCISRPYSLLGKPKRVLSLGLSHSSHGSKLNIVPATDAAMQRHPTDPRSHAQTAVVGPPSKIGLLKVEAIVAAHLSKKLCLEIGLECNTAYPITPKAKLIVEKLVNSFRN